MLKVAYSPIYKYKLPEGHRFPMIKYELLPEQLLHEGTLMESNFFHPDELTDEEVLLTHCHEYLDKLKNLTLSRKEERAIGFPVREDLIIRGRHIAKGTFLCAEYALKYGVALNIAGGTHHSFRDRGEGFCVFNDIAISANLMLSRGLAKKILIIDLDVHQGNGTASIFESTDEVFTFSMHGAKNYPLRKMKSDLDIGLVDGCDDPTYLNELKGTLPRLIEEVEPDFAFYLSGVDVLASDRLGRLGLTKSGCKRRDEFVFKTCQENQLPVAVSMGGGYSSMTRDIIEAHANTFRLAQEMYF